MIAYKGFSKDWKCRDFQFEVGKTYKHKGSVRACESGFHSCEYPLDVFGYYPPVESKYAIVHIGGETHSDGGDTKIASAEVTIKAEIDIPEIVKRSVEWIMGRVTPAEGAATNTGSESAATNTGYGSAATNTGDRSVAIVEGKHSVAIATGAESRASASKTGAIVLVYRDPNDAAIKHIFASKVGENGIKADVLYRLNAEGKPEAVE